MRILFAMALIASLSGCMSPDEARSAGKKAVEAHGFTNVSMSGPIFFGCGQDDAYRWEFIATSPSGQRVKGQACAGLWFKGWTVRIE